MRGESNVISAIVCYVGGMDMDPDLNPRHRPPTGNTRTIVNVRMKRPGVEWLDRLAADSRRTRSEVIRASIAVAARHEQELDALLRSED